METIALIQARMGSSRLPGKVLADLAGKPALERVVERVAAASRVDRVAVVTSNLPHDDTLETVCAAAGIMCLRGSETDVLDRFHQATTELRAERIVRITADCPLIDPTVIDALIELVGNQGDVSYASVATGAIRPDRGYRRFPDGFDAEVFDSTVLETAWLEAREPYEREHVTPFIWRHPGRFSARLLEAPFDLGDERWTIDYPEDLELVREIYTRLYVPGRQFGYEDIVALLNANPDLRMINSARSVSLSPRSPVQKETARGELHMRRP